MSEPAVRTPTSTNVLAVLLAWVLPGLGHWVLGYRRRARLLCAAVLGLYVVGLLIGGVYVINRRDAPYWYFGQVLIGPATPIIDAWRRARPTPDDPDDDPGYVYARPSFGNAEAIGTLYTTLAGMLNLMAILDALILPAAPAGGSERRERRA